MKISVKELYQRFDELNGKEVNSTDDVYHELEKFKIGDTINIEYLRDKKKRKKKKVGWNIVNYQEKVIVN